MPQTNPGAGEALSRAPSMLDLIRLSPRLVFPPGGVDLYRQIALLTDMAEGDEVLDVACGKGVTLEHFVREYGVHGSGVDPEARFIEVANARSRAGGVATRLQYQTAPSHALPYRDEIFDVAVGELGMAAVSDPLAAVSELVRVTKPGGRVALVQLAWRAPVDPGRARILSEHLGARPLMLVEWKRLLKDAGVGDIHAEEWSDEDASLRARVVKPFPDFAEIFSVPEKVGVLRRAWGRWGWKGVRTVLVREREVHKLLTHERILGLVLLLGRKRPTEAYQAVAEEAAAAGAAATRARGGHPARGVPALAGKGRRGKKHHDPDEGDPETEGLPLFGTGDEPE